MIRLLNFLFTHYEIGSRGPGDIYLTRWMLWGKRFGPGRKLCLHRFGRSDIDQATHDHPWCFWSLILWPGYYEEVPVNQDDPGGPRKKTWYGPLSLLRRPATWKHRVDLLTQDGKDVPCWTLIWQSDKVRSWSFWCGPKQVPWKNFEAKAAEVGNGCE